MANDVNTDYPINDLSEEMRSVLEKVQYKQQTSFGLTVGQLSYTQITHLISKLHKEILELGL